MREYEARAFRSPNERNVRLFGGFESFVGNCIFEEAALDAARAELPALTTTHGPGEEGMLMIEANDE
ncbi:MAG: hypothetical protein ACKVZJ_12360 [Phycisphaerales bacterium]